MCLSKLLRFSLHPLLVLPGKDYISVSCWILLILLRFDLTSYKNKRQNPKGREQEKDPSLLGTLTSVMSLSLALSLSSLSCSQIKKLKYFRT